MDFICKFCGKKYVNSGAMFQYNRDEQVCNDCTAELIDKFYITIKESLQKNVTPKELDFIKNHIFYDDVIDFFEENIFQNC